MHKENNELIVTSRDKDIAFDLLKAYSIDYINLGNGTIGGGAFGKMLYLIVAMLKILKLYFIKRPNIAISFSSLPVAVVCWIFKVPHISFDDTEHAVLNRMLYLPFTPLVISPLSFYKNLGRNHFRFKGYMELFYLHEKSFQPDPKILGLINIAKNEIFTVFRFVSWEAFHDIGQVGLNRKEKIEIVNEAKKYGKVFISSEGELPDELKNYELNISPEKLHNILFYSHLYIGEGGTTASECAMLGTPSIYINSLPLMGYLRDAEKYGLLHHMHSVNDIKNKMKIIYAKSKKHYNIKTNKMLNNNIDPTSLLNWIVKYYPNSRRRLLLNPDYQYKFK